MAGRSEDEGDRATPNIPWWRVNLSGSSVNVGDVLAGSTASTGLLGVGNTGVVVEASAQPTGPPVERPALRIALSERVMVDHQSTGIDLRAIEARAVLVRWQETLYSELRGQLDTRLRLDVVLARLEDGLSVEELRNVAVAAKESGTKRTHTPCMAHVLYGKPEMVERLAKTGR